MKRLVVILLCLTCLIVLADRRGQIMSQRPPTSGSSGPSTTTLYGWYRADTLALNDGDSVDTWPDQTGLGNDLTRLLTSVTYRTNAIGTLNGKPIVRLTSNNLPSLSRHGGITMGGTISGVTQVMVARVRHSAAFPTLYRTLTDFSDTAGSIRATEDAVNTTYDVDGAFPITEAIDEWQVLTLRLSNSANLVKLYTNTQTNGGAYASDVAGDDLGFINGFFEVAEATWYYTAISDSDLAVTRTYLANKYGITITK